MSPVPEDRLAEIDAIPDEAIDTSEIPEATPADFERGHWNKPDPLMDLAAAAFGIVAIPTEQAIEEALIRELADITISPAEADRRRKAASVALATNQLEAARVLAKGMCESQGCACSISGRRPDRWCISWTLYGDLALAAVMGAEEAGWTFVPPPNPAEPANDAGETGEPPETVLFAEFGPFGTENRPGAPSARFHEPGGPEAPPNPV